MANHNHQNFDARLNFASEILKKHFGFEVPATPKKITPLQYEESCPFKYNNFVYLITLSSPPTAPRFQTPTQPSTIPIPAATTQLILRLANPDTQGMHSENCVENGVAIISMASQALSKFKPHVVPRTNGWGSANSGRGWILQEFMPSEHLGDTFETMGIEQQKGIFAQMAEMLKALQEYEVPGTVTGLGGVWQTTALYMSQPLKSSMALYHADFTMSNILYNSTSGRITALIDYDFSTISHPSYEFLRSFSGAGGQFRGWTDDEESDQAALRHAKLHGFPSPLPLTKEDGVNWEMAKAWEDALEGAGARRPRNIEGIEGVADIDTILRSILPWRLTNEDIVAIQEREGVESIWQCKEENEVYLGKLLARLGF